MRLLRDVNESVKYAMILSQKINNDYFKSWALCDMVYDVMQIYHKYRMSEVLKIARDISRKIENNFFRVVALCEVGIGEYFDNVLNKKKIEDKYAPMVEKIEKYHSYASASAELMCLFGCMGDYEKLKEQFKKACDKIENIENDYYKSWAWASLGRSMAKCSRYSNNIKYVDEFLKYTDRISDEYHLCWVMCETASAYAACDRKKNAEKVLSDVEKKIYRIKDVQKMSEVMAEFVRAAVECGDNKKADAAVKKMISLSLPHQDYAKILVISNISKGLAHIKNFDESKKMIQNALDIARKIKFLYFRAWAFCAIVSAHSKTSSMEVMSFF